MLTPRKMTKTFGVLQRERQDKYGEQFNYKAAMDKLNKEKVAQDDPRLIRLIRDFYIDPPSELPYNLKHPDRKDYSKGQAPFIDSRLHYMVGFHTKCAMQPVVSSPD